jgi:hypothetical protein
MQHSIAGFQAQRAAASPSSNESSMLMRGHYYETFGSKKVCFRVSCACIDLVSVFSLVLSLETLYIMDFGKRLAPTL